MAPGFAFDAAKKLRGPYGDQTLVTVNRKRSLYFRARNASDVNSPSVLRQQEITFDPGGYRFRWYRGKKNISAAVKSDDGFKFSLPSGSRRYFRMTIEPRTSNPPPTCIGGVISGEPYGGASGYFRVNGGFCN